ncbi:MAG: exonuclease subunit SbcD [Succinivibrionaceae bacterium]|nr:exonuclease subunit SbcD [Succinivibrionaceae bacterium]
MKIIHTSDWHLGCSLEYHNRIYEHKCFFEFLRETIRKEQVDAVLVSGDIYDSANPATDYLKLLNEFLVSLFREFPNLQMVLTGGNHDSAARLGVDRTILEYLNTHLIPRIETTDGGKPDLERLIIPLKDSSGAVRAYCAALPFIRRADIPVTYASDRSYHEDQFANAVFALHRDLLDLMKARAQDGEKLIVMDHTTISGSKFSDNEAEHSIVIGNVESLSSDMYQGFDYVALGHIHAHQALGDNPPVVYSGSPIPISFTEKNYRHGVELITIDDDGKLSFQHVPAPRVVDIRTVPKEARPLSEVVEELKLLPEGELPPERYPFIEVQYLEDSSGMSAALSAGAYIKEALEGKDARLIKIRKIEKANPVGAEASKDASCIDVASLEPEEIFRQYYFDRRKEELPEALRLEFRRVLEEVRQQEQNDSRA